MINPLAAPIDLPSVTPIATIARVVAGSYRISLVNLMSDLREFAWERHVAIYISRELTGKSLPVIGRAFNRDHTTILHACRQVRKTIEADALKRADVEALIRALTLPPEKQVIHSQKEPESAQNAPICGRTDAEQKQERIAA